MSIASRLAVALLFPVISVTLPLSSHAQVYVGGVQSQIGSPYSPWSFPVGVASDPAGNIYVSENSNPGIVLKIDANTHATSTYTTSACGTALLYPQGLGSDSSNNLYIADQGNNRVIQYSLTTNTCTMAYNVNQPFAVTVDASGNIWSTSDAGSSSTVNKIPAGSTNANAATAVITSGLTSAKGMAFDQAQNLYISDTNANTVYKYTSPYSNSSGSAFLPSSAGSSFPFGLLFDANQNLYVCEANTNQVLKYIAPGYTTSVQVSPNIVYAEGVAQDPTGNLFLSAYQGNTVTEISPGTGNFGQVNVATTKTLALNFDVVSGTAVGSFHVVDQGVTGLEFQEPLPDTNSQLCPVGSSAYGSTTACAINVSFTPSYSGQRLGAVQALSPSGTVLATAYVSGTGLAPLIGFSPAGGALVNITGLSPAISGPRRPASMHREIYTSQIMAITAP